MREPQDLLREYALLDRKRKEEGITPLEYQHWRQLARSLERSFSQRPPLEAHGATRMIVEFKSRERLAQAVMLEVRPIGLFINTPFAPDHGTNLILCVRERETGQEFEAPVLVVSSNVGPNFSTATLGMGVRFVPANGPFIEFLDALCQEFGRKREAKPIRP